ncbi:2,4-dienoyl-CoA reductase [NADPH] [Pseudonocardia sp. Ae168_Ps1]|uniref:NADH:flavin oxidoreductase n=1 Tax=unclassified Pseudonocardia TaxID=2619320 RepID=UPI00094B2D1A|nr:MULTISPECIES: NADH:flavin oxidoreductase [unclassified Pseudonocardia]OLL72407.1 2,4-dienoyl-CoA reductase [NADPH] [Pseudonocardia sp. Ae150A_Ps1]OLL78379.1 2,4-dienoyl-CoA reductase [NADPH] [Pseudonocardia sp. Ae168_Ps1]OLL87495.1 2,4-dienoyl-CoA reductase [NADPH] [Pseudonocardia sp. Ae263_Ps1]OLL92476.1 2,4-dienoyl-CoA reductase [NADPH] [Pseudonocardia sp. Ae356_Ps1]
MSTRAAQILARPLTLGSAELPNRIVMAPMTRAFSPGGVPGDDVAAYYRRRAAAGTGLIITEGTYVDDPSAGDVPTVPFFHGEAALAGWGEVVSGVHEAGGRIMPQLWHVGITRAPGSEPFPEAPTVGPSGIGLDGTEDAGEALTVAGLERIIGAFAEAARQAERVGFDGVELHGAHGYLIDEFLWERTNRRTDSYAGGPAERARFAAEIVAAVRGAVSPDFPIVFRFSQWKAGDYAAKLARTPDELATVLTPLADAGVTAFHASGRRYWEPEFPESGSDLNVAGWARKVTGRPTITVGSVGLDQVFAPEMFAGGTARAGVESVERLLDRLEDDEFDLVAVGRALLADPEWAQKVLEGRESELVPFTKDALQTLH